MVIIIFIVVMECYPLVWHVFSGDNDMGLIQKILILLGALVVISLFIFTMYCGVMLNYGR